jgi:hypothetical protein
MKHNMKTILLAAAAALALTSAAQASNVNIFTEGGNASINLVQDRLRTSFGLTVTVNSTNKLLFKATGNWGGTNIVWNFNFTGGALAIQNISSQTADLLADGITSAIPVSVISAAAPEDVAVDSTPFVQDVTLVVPVVFVKNPNNSGTNDLVNVTNLTQQQAVVLETSGATVPTSYFGGTNGSTPLYFVGRNTAAAVRQLINTGIYYNSTIYNYTTNAFNSPIPYVGAASGGEVTNIIKVIPNSIGTVAAQDIGGLPVLSYNGVPFTVTNVLNGSYTLWGYERYIYYPSSDHRAPTGDQQSLIVALENAVSDYTYDHTSSLFVGKFVSFADLQNYPVGTGALAVTGVSKTSPYDDSSLIEPGPLSIPIGQTY